MLLASYQVPAAIRAGGPGRLDAWLRERKVGNAGKLAAARQQAVQLGEHLATSMIAILARR